MSQPELVRLSSPEDTARLQSILVQSFGGKLPGWQEFFDKLGREHVRASNDEEGREAFCKAPRPAFDDDFRPDPRRIANRYGEGRHAQRQLYSMKASLRRSRR